MKEDGMSLVRPCIWVFSARHALCSDAAMHVLEHVSSGQME